MGLISNIKNVFRPRTKTFSIAGNTKISSEQFKGEIVQQQTKFNKELGEEHPFDYSITEGLYKNFGLLTGIIDKFVDFVVGPGFFVTSDDERAVQIINDFLRETNFDNILRAWLKEALIKGNGYIEIGGKKEEQPQGMKILDAKFMYVKRNNKGEIKGYTQLIGDSKTFTKNKPINFDNFQIAHLPINHLGNDAYGIGIIFPSMVFVNNLIKNEKDLQMLMERKANSPLHIKVGNASTGEIPTQAEIDAYAEKVTSLKNNQEWVTDAMVELKAINFGDIGEKFESVLTHDLKMIMFSLQVPEVLMGAGSIPEGLAKVQMDAFERRIQSIQAEAEKVIENKILRRVLQSQGIDSHVEFEWGRPSNTERNERIGRITELLKIPTLSFALIQELEKDIARNLGIKEEKIETEEQEIEKEEEQENPKVPGQQKLMLSEELYKNFTLKEWLGFNYEKYLDFINKAIIRETFDDLKIITKNDRSLGKLSFSQITDLKEVLSNGFKEGQSINQIEKLINKKVKPKDLFREKEGKRILSINADSRPTIIARTETTRLANQGALDFYKNNKIEKVTYIASTGPRTCPLCLELNGRIFTINEAQGMIPVHVSCRCSFVPVTELI